MARGAAASINEVVVAAVAGAAPAARLDRRLAAEFMGAAMLVATVVGSGVMAARLSPDAALALLINAIASAAMLAVLIAVLAPISGAHLNPAVSVVAALRRELKWGELLPYGLAQVGGAVVGTLVAHAMFGLPLLQLSAHARTGAGQWLGELTASFGLVAVIIGAGRSRPAATPWLVGLYILSAYWFTSSTSFANPAVTIGRALTDSFAGIRPLDVLPFIACQLAGAIAAARLGSWLWPARSSASAPAPPSPTHGV